MKNKDVFADEIIKLAPVHVSATGEIKGCARSSCRSCIFYDKKDGCRTNYIKWLEKEYKPEDYVDWSKVDIDTPVFVRDSEDEDWVPRHFCKFEDGTLYAFQDGKTSFTSNDLSCISWKHMKKVGMNNLLDIIGITMRRGNSYRVAVKATDKMKEKWLEILNRDSNTPMTFEQAIKESCYTSNNEGYLVVEIAVDLDVNTYHTLYYYDNCEGLNVELSQEEKQQCLLFIHTWKNKLPDNDKLMLGDSEWADFLSDDIPWKNNIV